MQDEPSNEISRPRKMRSKVVVDGSSDLPSPNKAKGVVMNPPVPETEESRRIKEELRQQNEAAKAKLAKKKKDEPTEKERKRITTGSTAIEESRKRMRQVKESEVSTLAPTSFVGISDPTSFMMGMIAGASATILAQRLFGPEPVKAVAKVIEMADGE